MRSSTTILIIAFLWIAIFTGDSFAQITGGTCKDCHVMHFGQILGADGISRLSPTLAIRLARRLGGVSRAAEIIRTLGIKAALEMAKTRPIRGLTIKDCLGCHSSPGSETIENKTPIVYNTGGYPSRPLAGGNFYWVAQGSAYDQMGHNIYRVSSADGQLTEAPGNEGKVSCAGCHLSLAASPENNSYKKNGCEGCHLEVSHHKETKAYRFLAGCKGGSYYVEGVGDENWEQSPTSQNHNVYQGGDNLGYTWGTHLNTTNSISAFCAGCHVKFHLGSYIGSQSPWLRHPIDILLPQTGEYGEYNPNTAYSNQAPVAYQNPASPSRAEAVVMCLSCHRAHGSPYSDILRWDYDTMGQDEGCLTCHTQK